MRERGVIERIFRLKQQCEHLEEGLRESLQLSSAEFQLLRIVGGESMSCSDYAARTGRSASRMTRVVDGLVARGLVVRVQGSDRRTLMLELTAAGRTAQAGIVACEVRCESRLRERLGSRGYNEAVLVLGPLLEHTADTASITGA